MPLPLIPIGIAAVVGLFGVSKGAKAVSNNRRAQELNLEAESLFDETKAQLDEAKVSTTNKLVTLGKLKLNVLDITIGRFIALFETVRNVQLLESDGIHELDQSSALNLSTVDLLTMKDLSAKAGEAVAGGALALGSGALVAVASYGGAMALASASTGTAIATLSGVAATNATLAWFGGGALAAGGLGITGGIAVLGGIAAAPVLAVGGLLLEAKSKEKIANARSNIAQARKAAEEMRTAISLLDGISKVSDEFISVINQVNERYLVVLDNLEVSLISALRRQKRSIINIIRKLLFGYDINNLKYSRLSRSNKKLLHLSAQYAQVIKLLIETPLLTKDGALTGNYQEALDQGGSFLLSSGK